MYVCMRACVCACVHVCARVFHACLCVTESRVDGSMAEWYRPWDLRSLWPVRNSEREFDCLLCLLNIGAHCHHCKTSADSKLETESHRSMRNIKVSLPLTCSSLAHCVCCSHPLPPPQPLPQCLFLWFFFFTCQLAHSPASHHVLNKCSELFKSLRFQNDRYCYYYNQGQPLDQFGSPYLVYMSAHP